MSNVTIVGKVSDWTRSMQALLAKNRHELEQGYILERGEMLIHGNQNAYLGIREGCSPRTLSWTKSATPLNAINSMFKQLCPPRPSDPKL